MPAKPGPKPGSKTTPLKEIRKAEQKDKVPPSERLPTQPSERK